MISKNNCFIFVPNMVLTSQLCPQNCLLNIKETHCAGGPGGPEGVFTVNICTVWNNDSHYQPPLYAHHGLMPAPGVHRGGIPQCLQMTKTTPGCQIFEFWNFPSLPPIYYLEHLQPDQLVHWTVHCLHHLSQNKTKILHYGQTPEKNIKSNIKTAIYF